MDTEGLQQQEEDEKEEEEKDEVEKEEAGVGRSSEYLGHPPESIEAEKQVEEEDDADDDDDYDGGGGGGGGGGDDDGGGGGGEGGGGDDDGATAQLVRAGDIFLIVKICFLILEKKCFPIFTEFEMCHETQPHAPVFLCC